MLRIDDRLGSYALAAGEAFIMGVQMKTTPGNAIIDWSTRRLVLSFYGPGRSLVDQIEGVYTSDTTGAYFAFVRDGRFSESLLGQSVQVELAERLLDGRSIIATGPLVVAASSDGVMSFGGVIGRIECRFTLYFTPSGLLSLIEQELLPYSGVPITPGPVITRPAGISSDGTPQVGETLTGIDPDGNGPTIARRWLAGGVAVATARNYTATIEGPLRYEGDLRGPDGTIATSGSTITIGAAAPGGTVVPAPSGAPTTTGLLYRDSGTLAEWSAPSGTWILLDNPAVVPSVRSPITAQAPGPAGSSDYGGNREGFLFEDTDGTWYIFYGAGNGSTSDANGPWRPQVSMSIDRGVTWTKKGQLSPGLSKGFNNETWAAVDMLFFEKRASKYYLHRLTAGNVAVNQICAQPYTSDVWSADTVLGPYTYVGRTVESGGAGTPDAIDAYASCMVFHQGVYHLFYSSTSADGEYNCGLSTGPTPSGPFTKVSAALIPAGIKMQPENPEVYFDSHLNKWVMLVNQVNKGAGFTDRNRAFFSNSLTDWSAATFNELQQVGPGDGSEVIGMARIKRNPDNLPDFDVYGNYGVIYDSDPALLDYGKHTRRSLFYSQVEPFPRGYGVVEPAGATTIYSENFLAYTAGDLGGQGGWVDQSGSNARPRIVIVDANTKYLDMRSAVGAAAVSRSTDKLPAKNAKYTGAARFGEGCGVGFAFGWAANTAHFRVDIVRSTGTTTNFFVNFLAISASGVEANRSQQTIPNIPDGADFTYEVAQLGAVMSVTINGGPPVSYTMDAADEASTARDGGVFIRNGFGGTGERIIRRVAISLAQQSAAVIQPMMRAQPHTDFVAEFAVKPVSRTGVMEFIYRAQSAANRDNCYRINISLNGANIAATSASKVVAGVASDFADAPASGRTVVTREHFYSRFRVEVIGSRHRVYVDNQLQLDFTDATFATGAAVGFHHLLATTRIDRRGLYLYKPGGVTVNGLNDGDVVTLRGASGIPLASVTATGTSAKIDSRHYPCDRIDVNRVTRYRPATGVWGGDVYG